MQGEKILLHQAPATRMAVFVLPKVLFRRHPDFLFKSLSQIRAHMADGSVHGMVSGTGVYSPPGNAHVQHPFGELLTTRRVQAKIADQVLLRHARIVAVVARVYDEDVTLLDVYFARDVLRLDDVP